MTGRKTKLVTAALLVMCALGYGSWKVYRNYAKWKNVAVVFPADADDDGKEDLIFFYEASNRNVGSAVKALDPRKGETLWRATGPRVYNDFLKEENRIVACQGVLAVTTRDEYNVRFQVFAYELKSGQILWKYTLPDKRRFCLYVRLSTNGDAVVVHSRKGQQGYVTALDCVTGTQRWDVAVPTYYQLHPAYLEKRLVLYDEMALTVVDMATGEFLKRGTRGFGIGTTEGFFFFDTDNHLNRIGEDTVIEPVLLNNTPISLPSKARHLSESIAVHDGRIIWYDREGISFNALPFLPKRRRFRFVFPDGFRHKTSFNSWNMYRPAASSFN